MEIPERWLTFIAVCFIALLCLVAYPVFAHDHNRPELNGWLKSLHSKGKVWCCDGNDTDTIEDWDTKGGKFRVKWQGQWYTVPDDALVEGPNKGGGPLLWMSKGYMGVSVRCFMPGTLS